MKRALPTFAHRLKTHTTSGSQAREIAVDTRISSLRRNPEEWKRKQERNASTRAEFMHMFGDGDAPAASKKAEVKPPEAVEEPPPTRGMRIHRKESKKVAALRKQKEQGSQAAAGGGMVPAAVAKAGKNAAQVR